MTFDSFVPFLKDIYLTLNSWRQQRDENGWKVSNKQWFNYLSQQVEDGNLTEAEMEAGIKTEEAPLKVKATPGFCEAIKALSTLTDSETAPHVVVRYRQVLMAVYGVGDASGKGFGSAIGDASNPELSIRIGVWGSREGSDNSSNWREFTNVVEALEEEAAAGRLKDVEVFFCTDNKTVESALYSGTSSSKKLLDLVIRFKALQTKYSIQITVVHVSGKRMIASGGDGISRGMTNEGVMAGKTLLSFIPLHLSALERSDKVLPWIKTWLGENSFELEPIDWFERGHDITGWTKSSDGFWRPDFKAGRYIWAPPPGAADVALEEMRRARIKRQESTHVFVCPRLMTPMWMKQMYKVSDIVFEVPITSTVWGKEMYKPLLIGIAFPFIMSLPWQLRQTPKMYATTRELSKMWEDERLVPGDFLRKFCLECWRLGTLPEHLVRRVLLLPPRTEILRSGGGTKVKQGRRRGSIVLSMGRESHDSGES